MKTAIWLLLAFACSASAPSALGQSVVLPGGPPPVSPPPPIRTAEAKIEAPPSSHHGVIELKTGERVEGGFRQATDAGAVIDVAGQQITIPLAKVNAIYFGTPMPAAAKQPASAKLFEEALEALQELRSLWHPGVGLGYDAFASRLLDIRVKIEKYNNSKEANIEAGRAMRTAMLEYDLIRLGMNSEKLLFLSDMGSVMLDPEVSKCNAFYGMADPDLSRNQQALKEIYRSTASVKYKLIGQNHVFDQRDNLGLNLLVTVPFKSLIACASEQISQAEAFGRAK